MSHFNIVHLENYRKRKDVRFRRTLALHGHDPDRLRILGHLWDGINLAGADRGAVVWVDEYDPGLAHPHTLLDLAADRPRLGFSQDLLRVSRDARIPALVDLSGPDRRGEASGEGIASASLVSLGSDGPRSWVLVLDSLTPRRPLAQEAADHLMFLAGEITSVVLHPDLRKARHSRAGSGASGLEPLARGHFPGWPILQDLEGPVRDEEIERRVQCRFLVARLVRALLDDRLVVARESTLHQVEEIRREIGNFTSADAGEGESWARVLGAVANSDFQELTAATVEWGRQLDGEGYLNGALEILDSAHELATITGDADAAVDAARFKGKVHRTRAEWAPALSWYDQAGRLAAETGDRRRLALVLDGLANAHRDRGNLPRSREVLEDVLEIGREVADRSILAIGYHDLMTVRKLGGDLEGAIQDGWFAVQCYDSEDGKLRALFDLGSVLRERGELEAAWDAYSIVADRVLGLEARVLALDALAYTAALMRDEARHEAMRAKQNALGWEGVSNVYRAQVLYYQGLSLRALGKEEEGRLRLGEALSFAEAHQLNKLVFDAEAALNAKPLTPSPRVLEGEEEVTEAILGVRRGLKELVEAPAGVLG